MNSNEFSPHKIKYKSLNTKKIYVYFPQLQGASITNFKLVQMHLKTNKILIHNKN